MVLLMHHKRQHRHEPRALDGVRELPLMPRTHTRTLARHDLSERGKITLERLRILIVDLVYVDSAK